MSTYINDTLEGPAGPVPNPAAIGMSTFTGANISYVTPGWKLSSCVEFANGSYATKTGTWSKHFYDEVTFNAIDGPPTGADCDIMSFRVAGGAVVATLIGMQTGQLKLVGAAGATDTTTGTDWLDAKWVKVTRDGNQLHGYVTIRLYNRLEEFQTALRVKVGGATIGQYRMGAQTAAAAFRIRFAQLRMTDEPIYVAEPALDHQIFVLFDDAPAASYMVHMSEVVDLAASGAILRNHFEITPLCAPSRAAGQSGKAPLNNGVISNGGATAVFKEKPENERNSFYSLLSKRGYHVAHIGKWLHGYDTAGQGGANPTGPLWVPEGIDWAFLPSDGAYGQLDLVATQSRDGVAQLYDTTDDVVHPASDYLTDVLSTFAQEFVTTHLATRPGQPFVLVLAFYSGHNNAGATDPEDGGTFKVINPAAPRDRVKGPNWASTGWANPEFPLTGDQGDNPPTWPEYYFVDQAGNWNHHPSDAPAWQNNGVLTGTELTQYEREYRDVVRQMQSANDAIGALRAIAPDNKTWWDICSDNGYHRGQQGIKDGKGSPYDDDCRLPIVCRPPGGIDPIVVDALVQPIDFLPTFLDIAGASQLVPADVDGRSWLGFVTGQPPADWRQTCLMQYVSGDVTQQQSIGTGEPPSWYALRSADTLFVTYEPDTPGVLPDPDWGEAYDVATDPAMQTNLYRDLPAYRGYPLIGTLTSYLSASGADFWAIALQTITLGVGSTATVGGPAYVAAGMDLVDRWGRWDTLAVDYHGPGVPEKSIDDIEGTYGLEVSDDPYDQTMTSGPGILELTQLITDHDDQGRPAGGLLLARNVTAFTTHLDRRGVFPLGERPTVGMPVAWETRARILGDITPEYRESGRDKVTPLKFQLVDGVWHSPSVYTWENKFSGPTADEPMLIGTAAGSSAPIRGAVLRVHGPASGFTVIDKPSGLAFSWAGAVPVATNEWVLIDLKDWIARLLTTDTWDLTAGVDVSGPLDPNHGLEDLLILHPEAHEGDPFDLRYSIIASGAGRSDATMIQLQHRKTRRA